ncbi:MAG: hypothetical protein AAF495_07650 [Pseudomonadota bacterium]
MKNLQALQGLCVLLTALAGAPDARAAQSVDPDWPCIQRLVPEVSAGMVWAGPPLEEQADDWRSDPEISALAQQIAARRTPLEDAKSEVASFAAAQGGDKDSRLTLLFAGLLESVNQERASIIEGIRRYARGQASLADRIQRREDELAALPEQTSEDQRKAILEQQYWDSRVFDERTRSLTYLCEQPVLLEQRLFALSREIMGYLD